MWGIKYTFASFVTILHPHRSLWNDYCRCEGSSKIKKACREAAKTNPLRRSHTSEVGFVFQYPLQVIKKFPVALAQWSFDNRAHKPLFVLWKMKGQCSGIWYKANFNALLVATGFKTNRTLQKHISYLEKNGMIADYGNCYRLLSWGKICDMLDINYSHIFKFHKHVVDSKSFQSFMFAGIWSKLHGSIQHYFLRSKHGVRQARSSGMAFCEHEFDPNSRWFGMSNRALSKHLKLSRTRACQVKLTADKNKFVEVKQQRKTLTTVHGRAELMFFLKGLDRKGCMHIAYAIESDKYEVVRQMVDKITPKVFVKRIAA